MAGEEFKVRVGVELDDASFNALKNQINGTVQKEPIKVKVDIKEAENSVKSLKTQIESLGKTNISLSGTANIESALNDISSSVKEIKTSLSSLNGVSVKPKIDTTDVDKGISNVKSKTKNLNVAATPVDIKANTDNFDAAISSVSKKITVTAKNVGELRSKLSNDFGFDEQSIDRFTSGLDKAVISVDKIKTEIDGDNSFKITVTGENDIQQATTVVRQFKQELDEAGKLNWNLSSEKTISTDNLKRLKAEMKTISNDFKAGKIDYEINKITREFKKFGNEGAKSLEAAKTAFDNFKNAYGSLSDDPSSIQNFIKSYEELSVAMKKAEYDAKSLKLDSVSKLTKENDISRIKIWMQENSKATAKFGAELNKLLNQLEACNNAVDYDNTMKQVKNIQTQAKLEGKTGLSAKDSAIKKLKGYSTYFSVASLAFKAVQSLREMYQAVLEVDTAMTELKRVTNLSSNQYSDLYSELTVSAREYGTTLADIINATADWSRAGFDANTAKGLAEVTTMYMHIADVDYDTGVENLLTAYKGFQNQLDAQFGSDTVAAVSYIGDILNELDNNFSVTASGVGEALKRSASALDIAGNSIQETAAMVTGITEVTQDPEKAGNALKVLSMRLRGMKGDLEELGEEVDSNVTNLSKMQGQVLNLTHGKVDIFDNAGEFKSTYEIMQGIADIWEELSSTDQADLLETIAGKHRANDVAALIQNWSQVEKAVVSATEAEGSAAEEHAKYVDSIQGKLNSLTSVFQTFSNNVINSDLVKFVIDFAKSLLDVLDLLVDKIGGIGTLGLFSGIALVRKNIASGGNIAKFFSSLKGGISTLKDFGAAAKLAKEGISAFLHTPVGIITGVGAVVTVIASVISAFHAYQEEQRKLRQETIDESNKFSDAYGTFEQVYIKYSGKNVLTTDEENELKNAIDGTINALGNKSDALRDAAGASSEYVDNLEEIAKAELVEQQRAANAARKAAEENLKSEAGEYQFFSDKISKVDFELPKTDTDEYKALKDIIDDPNFKKYVNSDYRGWNNGIETQSWFRFDKDTNLDGLVEQYNYALAIQNKLSDEASRTGNSELLDSDTYKTVSEAINTMSSGIDTLIQQTYNAEKAGYQLENGIAKSNEEFFDMRNSILSGVSDSIEVRSLIGDLMNEEYNDIFDLSSVESKINYIKSITSGITDINDEGINTFETFLDIKTSLNDGDCTVGEYMAQMDKVNKVISGIEDEDTQNFLRVQLGLELDSDGNIKDDIKKLRDKLVHDLTAGGVGEDVVFKLADSLDKQELKAAVELVAEGEIDLKNIDIDDFTRQIEQRAELNKALRYSIDIETEEQGIESFNTALSETRSATGLTEDSIESLKSRYKSLDGYDAAKLFEETATGVRLNTEEVNRLEQAYADTNIEDIDNNLKILKDEYDELGVEIQNCSDINERAELYSRQEEVREKINELAELGAAYEGLTNAYAKWQNAESASTNRDMYSNVQSAMEGVKEELDLGWIDDGTKEYFDLIWGDNWDSAGKGIEDYRARWATLDDTISGTAHSIQDFFKTDEDGNITSEGITNFFDAVRQKQEQLGQNWLEFDEQGNLTTIDLGVNGEQAIADALGISEELVDIFMQASKDAGFVVTIDGKYTQLADLQNRAEEAAKTLKELGKTDFDFDFDTTSLQSVQEQLVEAKNVLDQFKNEDGTIKAEFIKSDGSFTEDAQAAIDVMSTLTAMADKLSEPKYMQLETNQVEDSLQEPLKDMQEFEELCKKKHQFEITGKNTDEIDQQMSEIVASLDSLSNETKIKLGIDGLTPEEIQQKLEAGEIEIPATVDIQMEMSDDLKDIRALLMHQAGMIGDEELTLMVNFDFDTSQINNLTPEEQTVVVNFMSDTSDIDSYTPEQKSAIVKYIKDIDDIESYTPTEKKAICDFIVNNDDVMNYTPEEKSAIAQYMVDPSNVDNFTPEQKEAVAKFIAEHGEVDSWSPEDRMAVARFLLNNAEVEGYQPSDKYPTVMYRKDSSEPDSYQPLDENSNVNYHVNSSEVDSYNPPDKHMTVWASIKKVASDLWNNLTGGGGSSGGTKNKTARADGTAYADGTVGKAFKQGDWGTNDSGKALVGELGQELLVRDGHYYTIGDNGAEFIDYKKGDIIFNAGQTKQLFEQGKITNGQTRGRAYAGGNVFDDGFNGSSLINLSGITGSTGVFNLDVSPINEDAISTLEEYNALLEDAIELGYDFNGQTVFGNIDTNNRQVLEWTDENINTYHDALKSWGNSDEDIADMKGSISTVMGSWGNFGENGEYEIAFSPMLQTDDGPVLLSADTVNDYINGLIAEASEDGVVTADELFALDARGEGNISGLLAAVGNSADAVSQLMHYTGKNGAIAMSVEVNGAKEATSDLSDLNDAASETKNYTGEKFSVVVDEYGVKDGVQNAIEWIDELNGYIEESASSTGLATESMEALTNRYKDLDGFDVASLFQESATGIQLNTDAVKKYEQQMAKDRSDKINKALKSLKREYYANAKAIKNCTDAQKKQQLTERNAAIREEIKSIDALSAAYDGATSKYNQWAEASSKSKQREPYDNINNEFDNVLDLLDRGWLGDEEVTSFLDLIYGDNYDTAGKTADEVAADLRNKMSQTIEGTSYSIGDFFTYDDNGNTTADGYFNMLDAIMQKQQELGKNWVQMDENGNYTFDFGVNGLDEIAEAFGISKDLLALILQAGRDAGHEVNFGGVIENIDALEQKATSAVDKLHEIGATDYQFDLDTGDVDSLTEQLDVANGILDQYRNEDGTINMDIEGAQEALELVQYLTAQMDLVNSHYINIQTDDESLQEPLEKIQDYEILAAEVNSLSINPQVNADEIAAAEQEMQEIVDYFASLDGETLAKLGFNFEGLSQEEIQQQIAEAIKNGTVTIPAKLDVDNPDSLAVNGDKEASVTLNTIVDKAGVEAGERWLAIYNSFPPEQEAERTAFVRATSELANFDPDAVEQYMDVFEKAPDEDKSVLLSASSTLSGHPEELNNFITTYNNMPDEDKSSFLEGSAIFEYDEEGLNDYTVGYNNAPEGQKESYVKGVLTYKYDKDSAKTFVRIYNETPAEDKEAFLKAHAEFEYNSSESKEFLGVYDELPQEDKRVYCNYVIEFGEDGGEESASKVVDFYKNVPAEDRESTLSVIADIQDQTVADKMLEMCTYADGTTRQAIIDIVVTGDTDALNTLTESGALSEENAQVVEQAADDYAHRGEHYVGSLNGMSRDETQNYIDTSGVKEAATDAAHLREVLGGLSNDELATLLTMLGAGTDDVEVMNANVEDLKSNLSEMSDEDIVGLFSNLFPGIGQSGLEAITANVENFMTFWNSLDDESQIQLAMKLLGVDEVEQQVGQVNQELDDVNGKTATATVSVDNSGAATQSGEATTVLKADDSDVAAKASEQRTTPVRFAPDTSSITTVLSRGFSTVARITPQLTTSVLNVKINTTTNASSSNGSSDANGTAYANGTVGKAFKHGNWGTSDSGTALVGELGQEMVVRDGRFFTVGDNGAEFFNYKKGDIVFNAGQTKQLFEQGKIVNGQTRGRAYVNGTAFSVGTASGGGGRRPKTTTTGSRGTYTGSGGGSSDSDSSGDSSDEADDFSETLDWIETKLDRIERAVSKLDTTASSVYKNWGTRNEALANQISKVGEEINLQQQAYDRYLQQANSIGLSEDYASKVRDGTVDIETITDEDLNDKISEYKEWY